MDADGCRVAPARRPSPMSDASPRTPRSTRSFGGAGRRFGRASRRPASPCPSTSSRRSRAFSAALSWCRASSGTAAHTAGRAPRCRGRGPLRVAPPTALLGQFDEECIFNRRAGLFALLRAAAPHRRRARAYRRGGHPRGNELARDAAAARPSTGAAVARPGRRHRGLQPSLGRRGCLARAVRRAPPRCALGAPDLRSEPPAIMRRDRSQSRPASLTLTISVIEPAEDARAAS